ncbi:DUF4097 family beta strand repeat-containing protein [Candidatus Enterococcus lemimoniae]|uniref:DUF4097 domain-containing protein n=1 Tax=Candidatus Enterococcus lemimoniae TaxID=1834167 RepID=A0ABZ2T5D5_9ENTE|nr:DUF4097 family beta strand repeat-containing protein [Enterococcus sp. 12C11_DIV0727]OTO68182.1 hypothetical protein A5866_000377 [Enterococcus sp. 12C11_DIV0727]
MEQIKAFFGKLESQFLENDKEAFEDIKEDIMHEIEERRAEGEPYEKIIHSLGTPEDISAAYYEDKRLDKAMKAEQDVIDRDELEKEYKLKRKKVRAKRKRKITLIVLMMTRGILILLSVLFLLMTVFYFVQEQTVVWGPLTAAVFFLAMLLLCYKSITYKWLIGAFGLCSLCASMVIFATNSWFYAGQFFNQTVSVESTSLETLKIKSENPVDFSVIRISKKEKPKVEMTGYLTKKDQKKIVKSTKNSLELTIGKKSQFDWANQLKATQIILYLPEELSQKQVEFQVNEGEISLDHMAIDKLFIAINEGECRLTDINSEKLTVNSRDADIFVRHFFSNITVDNQYGKSILSDGQGDIQIQSTTGLVNVSNISGKKGKLVNKKGKNILASSVIKKLTIQNDEGITVADTQEGDTTIKNGTGKVVLTDMKHHLNISNTTGTIIINEQYPVDTVIESDTGDVKWVQTAEVDTAFDLTSDIGEINNTFKHREGASHQVKINTKSGNIKIISND